MSSLQAKAGFPHSTGYAASKWALQGFFESLRIELAGTGVDVLIVSPGPVATRIHTRRIAGIPTAAEVEAMERDTSMMSVDLCVSKIVRSINRRDRELITHASGRMLPWFRLLFPALCDRYLSAAVRRFYGYS